MAGEQLAGPAAGKATPPRQVLAVGQREVERPEVLRLPDPGPPGADEVRVRVLASAIGVAEVRAFTGARMSLHGQRIDPERPFVFGFAAVGVVEASGAAAIPAGQRVVITPFDTCGRCRSCRAEDETRCTERRRLAGIDADSPGLMRQMVVLPARRVVPIPEQIDDLRGCYVSEVATAVHACRRADVRPGHRVAVVGTGRHGRLVIAVARARGAVEVVGIDPSERARAAATAQGAHEVRPDFRGAGGFDVVVQCNSAMESIGDCCDLARPGGTVLLLGTPPKETPDIAVDRFLSRVIEAERRLVASASKGTSSFREAVDLVARGAVRLELVDPVVVPISGAPDQLRRTAEAWPAGPPAFVRVSEEAA